MFLAKVIGSVVATQKHQAFQGSKLLLLQPYVAQERTLVPSGSSVVAIDSVGAGLGEFVMFTQGSSARLAAQTKDTPVDAVIVGIVDRVEDRRDEAREAVMLDRKQMVAEIADEVVSRLLAHLDGPAPPRPRPANGRAARRAGEEERRPRRATASSRPWTRPSRRRREAQVRVAEMSLEERGRMIAVIRRICDEQAEELGPDGARRDAHRPPRSQDRQAAGPCATCSASRRCRATRAATARACA